MYHGEVDGDDYELYVDGVLEATGELTTDTQPGELVVGTTPFIGSADYRPEGENKPVTGTVDEVRIWDHARSAEELADHRSRSLTGSEDGLLVYYSFNVDIAGAGTVIPNVAVQGGAAFDGVTEGSAATPQSAPSGAISE